MSTCHRFRSRKNVGYPPAVCFTMDCKGMGRWLHEIIHVFISFRTSYFSMQAKNIVAKAAQVSAGSAQEAGPSWGDTHQKRTDRRRFARIRIAVSEKVGAATRRRAGPTKIRVGRVDAKGFMHAIEPPLRGSEKH